LALGVTTRKDALVRAIILSAGRGSRLGALTVDRPKCLIELSGQTLLDWQLDHLVAAGVDEFVVVTGFRDDQVEAALARRSDNVSVRTMFNPFYQVADNLGTVWVAKDAFSGDCLVLNGDTIVSREIAEKVVTAGIPGITVTVDESDGDYDDDDMKVVRESDGRLRRIGKQLGSSSINAESIGMIVFRGDGAQRFVDAVDAMMRTPEGTTNWYLKVIDVLAAESRVETLSIKGMQWAEVDFLEDVALASALTADWKRAGDGARGSQPD
jgi:choline kinase